MRGDLTSTDTHLREAKQLATDAQSVNAELMVATLSFARGVATGSLAQQIGLLEEVFSPFWDVPMAQCYLTYFLLEAGDRVRAEKLLGVRAAAGVGAVGKDAEWLTCTTLMGEAARRMGHRGVVEDCYQALRPYADLWLFDGVGAGVLRAGRRIPDQIREVPRCCGFRPPESVPSAGGRSTVRSGAGWTVGWRGHSVTVADAKGVRDLAVLLAHPHTSVHVLDLVGADPSATGAAIESWSASPSEYKQRLRELATEIEDAEVLQQPARAERLRSERDVITRELATALGLGGRRGSSAIPWSGPARPSRCE